MLLSKQHTSCCLGESPGPHPLSHDGHPPPVLDLVPPASTPVDLPHDVILCAERAALRSVHSSSGH